MTVETRSPGETLVAISNRIVAIYKELYGKGPVKVRTWYLDDIVVCVLRGGLTRSEHTLVDIGRGDRVVLQRESFHAAVAPVLGQAVEELVGRRVQNVLHSVDESDDISTLLFVLEPEEDAALRDTKQGLLNEGRQIRKQSAVVREEASALRKQHQRIREEKNR